jgi:hypothetical protein
VSAQSFSGQVYLLAEKFLEDKCQVLTEEKDCSTDLIFLNDKTFAMVNRCKFNQAYYTGKYVKKKDKLFLTFKQVVAREVYDPAKDKKTYEKKKEVIQPVELNITLCEAGKITLEHPSIKEYKNGSRLLGRIAREKLTKLKIAKAWKMIST